MFRRDSNDLVVQTLRSENIVIDHLDLKTTLRRRGQVLDELIQLRPSNTICTIHRDRPMEFSGSYCSFERSTNLLVVALFGWFPIFIRGTFGIDAAGDVVQLRGCKKLIVFVFTSRSIKSSK